ncbi:MAG: hypothetical protein Q8K86_11555 [Candidatus Nanopelagicaceae bacterium]|nr:hypothetical protein [Candidatus Nanopelagicaceae bacterium]
MPTINPALVPTIPPGQIFSRLTTDATLSVRWLVADDPVYFDVTNRPIADVALRQLIIAKALDVISLRLAFLSQFPFLITPTITGSVRHELPANWIWDMHVSVPSKWRLLRLAKIKRVSGANDPGTGSGPTYTGKMRLIFTASTATNPLETALFEVDYQLDSVLTYQMALVKAVEPGEESAAIDPAEAATIAGYVVFRTLDSTDPVTQDFYTLIAPPTGSEGSTGEYVTPAIYDMDDSPGGDFWATVVTHGTGTLVPSAYNVLPAIDSDANVWLDAFNYPFSLAADRTSTSPIVVQIPKALFMEFDIAVPAGDGPTTDTTGLFYPVWISRIERLTVNRLSFIFSTYNVTDDAPSVAPVEFASLTLDDTFLAGRVVPIIPLNNLKNQYGTDAANFNQHLGRGHVVLSGKWAVGNTEITSFYGAIAAVIDFPPNVLFDKEATRVSSYGLSRVPKYVPTIGEAQALVGSSARRLVPINPNDDNRYVTELDQGLGDRFDFQTCTELDPAKRTNVDIERYGYMGGLVGRFVCLFINENGTAHDYDNDVLPRLKCLLGRAPIVGDRLFDGTRVKTCVPTSDGETVWVG